MLKQNGRAADLTTMDPSAPRTPAPRGRLAAVGSEESGLIGVGTVIAIGIAVLFVYLLLAAFDTDSTEYGSVPVPTNRAPVELPAWDVDIYLADAAERGSGDLDVPESLDVTVLGEDGQSATIEARGDSETEETESGRQKLFAAVKAPEDGRYLVSVASSGTAGLVRPEITFGQSPTGAVKDRFDAVVDELKGPTGIAVAALLLFLFFAPRFMRAFKG